MRETDPFIGFTRLLGFWHEFAYPTCAKKPLTPQPRLFGELITKWNTVDANTGCYLNIYILVIGLYWVETDLHVELA